MTRPAHPISSDRRGRFGSAPLIAAAIVVVGFAVLVAMSVTPPDRSVFDATLPNPMGGMARTAPGEVTGEVQLAEEYGVSRGTVRQALRPLRERMEDEHDDEPDYTPSRGRMRTEPRI